MDRDATMHPSALRCHSPAQCYGSLLDHDRKTKPAIEAYGSSRYRTVTLRGASLGPQSTRLAIWTSRTLDENELKLACIRRIGLVVVVLWALVHGFDFPRFKRRNRAAEVR